jgi:hypothetical protein
MQTVDVRGMEVAAHARRAIEAQGYRVVDAP